MPESIETVVVLLSLAVLAVSVMLCVVRAARGPSMFDRVLAFDCIALHVVGATLLVSMLLDTDAFIDLALVIALLGFLGTIALAAYLEGTLVD